MLSIIIPHYRRRHRLEAALLACRAVQGIADREVIVVDNHSRDGTPEWIRDRFPEVRVFENPDDLGYAAAVNRGIRESRGSWLLVSTDDTRLPPSAPARLLDFALTHGRERLGIVAPTLVNDNGTRQPSAGPFPTLASTLWRMGLPKSRRKFYLRPPLGPRRVDWVSGACFLARRRMADDVGPLEESFFLYYEDADWCLRAHRAGWEIWHHPRVLVPHGEPHALRPEISVPLERVIRRASLIYFRRNRPEEYDRYLRATRTLLRLQALRARFVGADPGVPLSILEGVEKASREIATQANSA